MKEFIEYLLKFGNLNKQQINLITSKATELELPKDGYFWEAGKMPKHIGFIVEGVVRVAYYDNKGEEITKYFFDENHLIKDWDNFEATFYLQAVTDCKFIRFTKKDWKEISDTILDWDKMIDKIMIKNHTEKMNNIAPLISQEATTRYLEFLKKFPNTVNRIPLSYVASYLGITQQSLSRIRKNIS
ncbi:Crp/Fnr family transcriptional regulator [Sphingobacterium bambusae]|uniref:Crp/Fnr family transcriptional regulator n=1 Tax=Sphingobacterium bambusae TaxID=662858 RepID=A0ABW6BKF5_9SPHI|nr:Crp/Fnr family transcriptional regulator [Sphingobacterium bambusae]WPL49448.1 Crp/Fnr family transcriptional regulator [Sphingobacterium bambusae]